MQNIIITSLFVIFSIQIIAQNNIGIGTNTPDASAKLDIQATDKGLLTPQIDLNTTVFPGSGPAKGLMVWNTNNSFKSGEGFYYNEGTKTAPSWVRFGKYSNSNLTDVGVVIAFPGASYPNDMYLPLNGGVYNKIDYPDFVEMIASLDANVVTSDATTFTLADWNSNGEFLRGQGGGSSVIGAMQTDATARPTTAFTTATTTITGGSHTHNHSRITSFETAGWSSAYSFGSKTVPTSGWSGSRMTGEGGAAGIESGLRFKSEVLNTSSSSHSHNLPALNVTGGGDTETRPVNRSVTWLIKVKPSSAIVDTLIVNNYIQNTVATDGDVKTGFQNGDHNGWIKLDGRSLTTLTTTQQTVAGSLGFSGNLPNADDRVLMSRSAGVVGDTGGSSSTSISQANLPNVSFTGSTSSNGNHTHSFSRPRGDQNWSNGGGNSWWGPSNNTTQTTSASGNHTHTVSVNSGGTGTALDTTPSYLQINTFVYLGN